MGREYLDTSPETLAFRYKNLQKVKQPGDFAQLLHFLQITKIVPTLRLGESCGK